MVAWWRRRGGGARRWLRQQRWGAIAAQRTVFDEGTQDPEQQDGSHAGDGQREVVEPEVVAVPGQDEGDEGRKHLQERCVLVMPLHLHVADDATAHLAALDVILDLTALGSGALELLEAALLAPARGRALHGHGICVRDKQGGQHGLAGGRKKK